MAKLFANSEDPDQMPHSVASDQGQHCLPVTLSGVSSLNSITMLLNIVSDQLTMSDHG